MLDFLSVGEVLIDMTPASTAAGEGCFLPKVGGAPVNAACMAARLGLRAAFAGRAGEDGFGRQIRSVLEENGLDCSMLQFDRARHTTLAFVHLSEGGERDFSFYRKGLADVCFEADEKVLQQAREARMVHFGSVALAEEPARSAVLTVVRAAGEGGAVISYDPNLRFALWDDRERLRSTVLETLPLADVIKVSDEEAEFLLGRSDPEKAAEKLQERFGAKAVFVTCGHAGAWGRVNGVTAFSPALQVETVDTTGAGDCFLGAAAYCLLTARRTLNDPWTQEEVKHLLHFACTAGSLATTRRGAIDALPTLEEIRQGMTGA